MLPVTERIPTVAFAVDHEQRQRGGSVNDPNAARHPQYLPRLIG